MPLDKEFVKTALDKLTTHYAAADERRRRAMREMVEAQAAIKAIYALGTDEPLEFKGKLADACRVALKGSPAGLTPIEVRNAIVALGYDLTKKHKNNPLASVHSVLKSFEKSKKARQAEVSTETENGRVDKVVYQWIGDQPSSQVTSAKSGDVYSDPYLYSFDNFDMTGMNSFAKSIQEIFDSTDIAKMKRAIDAAPNMTVSMKNAITAMNKIKP